MKRGIRTRAGVLLCLLLVFLTGCSRTVMESATGNPKKTQGSDIDREEQSAISFEEENAGHFAYDRLSKVEQQWYEDINRVLAFRMEEEQELSKEGIKKGLSEEDLDRIYNCVMMDHPEYFYVDGYEYTLYNRGSKLVGIKVSGQYMYDLQECLDRQAEIKEKVAEILALSPNYGGDYEKIKYVYEYIIHETDYNALASDNQNIYSVFIQNASVCQGYAKAAQYLLNRMGVECGLVYGKVHSGESHSWNIVKADDAYYYMDTTWGDASYSMGGEILESGDAPEINYDYLCVTTSQIEKTHIMEEVVELPVCDSTEDNFYVREGFYLEEYDQYKLDGVFMKALSMGGNVVTIKCASGEVFDLFFERLINNQEIFNYLSADYGGISYNVNEKQLTLTFWVTN